MESIILNCEEEQIHLCGKIQNFGYLIVFDENFNCTAISENCLTWIPCDPKLLLNKHLDFFLPHIELDGNLHLDIKDLNKLNKRSLTYKVKIQSKDYQLTIYYKNNQIFFEFEQNYKSDFELTKISNFQLEFEQSDNIWQTLCENVYNIIDFDRIMVYQFLEDKSGIVIAENIRDYMEPLIGYRYPEFDIPSQARQLYLANLSRQTSNIHAETRRRRTGARNLHRRAVLCRDVRRGRHNGDWLFRRRRRSGRRGGDRHSLQIQQFTCALDQSKR